MNATRLIAIAIVGVLLVGGAAAVGAAVPTDAPNPDGEVDAANVSDGTPADGSHSDGAPADENASDRAGADENASDRAGDEHRDSAGPVGGLPEAVPDHVSEIHETIGSFLDGSIDHLGEALSGSLGPDR